LPPNPTQGRGSGQARPFGGGKAFHSEELPSSILPLNVRTDQAQLPSNWRARMLILLACILVVSDRGASSEVANKGGVYEKGHIYLWHY
jgi:hypothetical protein